MQIIIIRALVQSASIQALTKKKRKTYGCAKPQHLALIGILLKPEIIIPTWEANTTTLESSSQYPSDTTLIPGSN